MALTMTRKRTQTALTKLAELVANVHGELALVERLLDEARAVLVAEAEVVESPLEESPQGPVQESSVMQRRRASAMAKAEARTKTAQGQVRALERKHQELLELRESLYATVRQFDPGLNPADIGADDGWLKQFGRGGGKAAVRRYLEALGSAP